VRGGTTERLVTCKSFTSPKEAKKKGGEKKLFRKLLSGEERNKKSTFPPSEKRGFLEHHEKGQRFGIEIFLTKKGNARDLGQARRTEG